MLNRHIVTLDADWRIEGMELEQGLIDGAYRRDYQPRDYMTATAPVTVQSALEMAGKIPDPRQGFNCLELSWIEKKEWWFFNEFRTPPTTGGQRVFVRFEGITYQAEVWVNGVQAGLLRGMFRSDDIDVTDLLNGDVNRLTLRVRAQERCWDERSGSALRAQIPVAQSMFGWNWCPSIFCIGLWRPVNLLLKSPVELALVSIRTLSVTAGGEDGFSTPRADAELLLSWRVKNGGASRRSLRIDYAIHGETFDGTELARGIVPIFVEAGRTEVVEARLKLKDARLWWCNGLGEANLHKLETTLTDDDGTEIEGRSDIFGVRTVSFLRNEDEAWVVKTSAHSERPWSMVGEMHPWTLVLNNRKVFMKGSNWVMLDSLLRLERWRYDRQLRLVKAGGLNFLRVWGGSLAETHDFYDLCDRYGILCWQEFWLACASYPAMDHELFIHCVGDTVRRLINHASLVMYTGGNEFNPDTPENKDLVDKIDIAVRENDGEREFRRGSPYKGDRHGGLVPTPLITRNKYLDIMPGEKRIALMRSEVAVGRSTPMRSSLEKMIPEDRRWPLNERLWRHFFGVPCEFIMFACEYDSMDSFEQASYANHLVHIQICRVNMEFCRTRMFKSSGNLNWQFNVPWPCLHREIVDMWGVPKPAYHHYVNASKPAIATIDLEKYLWNPGELFNPAVFTANDAQAEERARIDVTIMLVGGMVLHRRSFEVALQDNAAAMAGRLDFTIPRDLSGKTLFVRTELFVDGSRIHENLYWIAVSNNPEPSAKIDLDGLWRSADGDMIELPGNDMSIPNPSFEYVILKNKVSADLESADGTCQSGGGAKQPRHYTRTFSIPSELQGNELEFFCPGFESGDEVHVNGVRIGGHEFEGQKLDTGKWCFIPAGRKNTSINVDRTSEYLYYSDPISLPKLDARFYDIPMEALNPDDDNEIRLTITSDYQKACSNHMEIRPRTLNRSKIAAYLKKGVFFKDLRRMPMANVEVTVDGNHITLENRSEAVAFMLIVEIIPKDTGVALPLSDNAINIMPGEIKSLKPLFEDAIPKPSKLWIYGWNVEEKVLQIVEPGCLDA